ncbi:fungal specific transcription factor [Colletotrichum sojae]|uniref:Fungal specific transcription factor n=1 Tax=Colletotrichum sojae TaxID=2175907 RepID=A0A8H6MU45_9PEZI|nr:fungal specific transcription factor [Colletotrichum sojae]
MSTANRSSQSPQSSPAPKAQKGLMNCKPCQTRKVAHGNAEGVPKKRGPKKESLSALIRRIDGLEELLKSEKTPTPPGTDNIVTEFNEAHSFRGSTGDTCGSTSSDISPLSSLRGGNFDAYSGASSIINAEGLVELYFKNFHRNPYEILDESVTRQKLRSNQLPRCILYAICAVATGFCGRSGKAPSSHVSAETYAVWAQKEVEQAVSLDSCKALLLLVTAHASMGNGSQAYILLSHAVGMAMALELYTQPEKHGSHTQPEDEQKKRLFWNCYIINAFVSTWLERPSLIDDSLIKADIQSTRQSYQGSWLPTNDELTMEPDCDPRQPADALRSLVWVSQILCEGNRYLLLSDATSQAAYCQRHKILHDLDLWASDVSRNFGDLAQSPEEPMSQTLFVCRLVFHLIHCLIHRPILPLRLGEPSRVRMIQHWVVEATENAFRHATAITELVGQTRETRELRLPPFVGFCIFTAGTIFNYGIFYAEDPGSQGLGVCLPPFAGSPMAPTLFSASPEHLARCFNELSILNDSYDSARLYRLMLDELKAEHAALLDGNVAGYVSVFSNRFFQRYSTGLRQKIHGFFSDDATSESVASVPATSPLSVTHDDRLRKDSDATLGWEGSQPFHGRFPFVPARPSVGIPSSHPSGHHRSFSDSLSLSQYACDGGGSLSQRPLPTWSGFQDATPRQGPGPGSLLLDPSGQLESPICPTDSAMGGGPTSWGSGKEYPMAEQLSFDALAGSVAPPPTGPTYRPAEELASSFIPYHNFVP